MRPINPATMPNGNATNDEAALAREAYAAAARRLERGVRARVAAPYEPPPRDPEADTAEPGLVERIRLNGVDSFYRGTILGAGRLAGRPLIARYIAGRRMTGGNDVGLEPRETYNLIRKIIGTPPELVPNDALQGAYGLYLPRRDDKGLPSRPEVWLNELLSDLQMQRVMAHEAGHMIEDFAVGPRRMPIRGLKQELEPVYSTLNSGVEERQPLLLPKDMKYSKSESPFELVAEAIRAYLTNPNYLKTVAPNTAASIRAMVNSHPQLSKWIQFNSLGGLAALRGGTAGTPTTGRTMGVNDSMDTRRPCKEHFNDCSGRRHHDSRWRSV
jgi:hypothetical protein